MTSFTALLHPVREEVVVAGMPSEEQVAYVRDEHRQREAKVVEPCVARLADYEINPPSRGKGLGASRQRP